MTTTATEIATAPAPAVAEDYIATIARLKNRVKFLEKTNRKITTQLRNYARAMTAYAKNIDSSLDESSTDPEEEHEEPLTEEKSVERRFDSEPAWLDLWTDMDNKSSVVTEMKVEEWKKTGNVPEDVMTAPLDNPIDRSAPMKRKYRSKFFRKMLIGLKDVSASKNEILKVTNNGYLDKYKTIRKLQKPLKESIDSMEKLKTEAASNPSLRPDVTAKVFNVNKLIEEYNDKVLGLVAFQKKRNDLVRSKFDDLNLECVKPFYIFLDTIRQRLYGNDIGAMTVEHYKILMDGFIKSDVLFMGALTKVSESLKADGWQPVVHTIEMLVE